MKRLVSAPRKLAAQLHLKRMARIIVDDDARAAALGPADFLLGRCLSLLKNS